MALGRTSVDGSIFSCTELCSPSHYKSHNCGMYFQNRSSGMDHFCLCLSSCDFGQVMGNSEYFKAVKFREENQKDDSVGSSFLACLLGRRETFSTTTSYQDCQPVSCSRKMHLHDKRRISVACIRSLNTGCSAQDYRKDHYGRL